MKSKLVQTYYAFHADWEMTVFSVNVVPVADLSVRYHASRYLDISVHLALPSLSLSVFDINKMLINQQSAAT